MKQESPTAGGTTDAEVTGAGVADAVETVNEDAGTSTAESAKDDKPAELDLQAVIDQALKGDKDDSSDTSTDEKDGEEQASADASKTEEPKGEKPEEDPAKQAEADAKLPFGKHPRFKQLIGERNKYKGLVTEREQQLNEWKPKVEQFERIGTFMRENQLTPEEMHAGFEIMALMKHAPDKALEGLRPYIEKLELATGVRLPQDLSEKVERGETTEEVAREAALLRMKAGEAESRAKRVEQTSLEERAHQARTAMRTAVESWESSIKGSDPDYPHIQSFVVDRVRSLAAAEPPRSPEEAVALTKRAYAEVRERFSKVIPAKPATKVVTSDKSTSSAAPAPKSMLDIVSMALRS